MTCDSCGDPICESGELVGITGATVIKIGVAHWLVIAGYKDTSDTGVQLRRCLTKWGAQRAAEKMAANLAKIRTDVLNAQKEGK